MNKHTIELFMPLASGGRIPYAAEQLMAEQQVTHVWLWGEEAPNGNLPPKTTVLLTELTLSTRCFKDMAERASADFVLFITNPNVEISLEQLMKLCDTMPAEASMAYGHYRKKTGDTVSDAPTIDCQDGSLRNDFDFGPVRLFRTSALKQYLETELAEYEYAGLYQLRLALSRFGSIYHFNEYLSVAGENDNRKSGEKQFDYVNPAQRDVQVEMEHVCTSHLRSVGAWLPPCKYSKIDLSNGDFPVEASVVIPVLNREMTIGDAISSVLEQETAFKFNVLVVDNHSTDRTAEIIDSFDDNRVVHIVPETRDLGIGGCWNLAVNDPRCGRFAVQLDSDDIYSGKDTLQKIVDEFYRQECAMLVGTYRICDFELNTLPPGVIDHREWTEDNGRNNALRINGLGAPRAFYTPVIREAGFPNVSYGEDYAVGLQISRNYRIGRIYDVLYLCRRWGGNSDAALSHEKVNAHNLYKDSLRTAEFNARKALVNGMKTPSQEELEQIFNNQLKCWSEAAERYSSLEYVEQRKLDNGLVLQYNPSRAVSTAAKVDADSIKNRMCFLCPANRPESQLAETALAEMEVLVNPYPILPFHFTVPMKEHTPQLLDKMYQNMLLLAGEWRDMALFYNGAKCGASAPDHAHLQAVRSCDIPLLGTEWQEKLSVEPQLLDHDGMIASVCGYHVPLFLVQSGCLSTSMRLFERLLSAMPLVDDELEPRMNVICRYIPGEGYATYVIPRSLHRPLCYGVDGENGRMVSPGTLDMAGLVVTPRECDFTGMSPEEVVRILKEVGINESTMAGIQEKIICGDEND